VALTVPANKIDLGRLSKVLALTTSSNDGEALVAARKAAKLLHDANLTYRDVICPAVAAPDTGNEQSKVLRAWMLVRELRSEVARLRAQPGNDEKDGHSGLRRLQDRLLKEPMLRTWERQTLSRITDIRPGSREDFYLRWLARRYELAD
jgi:hypothetical protein